MPKTYNAERTCSWSSKQWHKGHSLLPTRCSIQPPMGNFFHKPRRIKLRFHFGRYNRPKCFYTSGGCRGASCLHKEQCAPTSPHHPLLIRCRLWAPSSGTNDRNRRSWAPISYAILFAYATSSKCFKRTTPAITKSRHLTTPFRTSFGDMYANPVSPGKKQQMPDAHSVQQMGQRWGNPPSPSCRTCE